MINKNSLFQNLALNKTLYPHAILRQKKKKVGQLDYSFNVCQTKLEYLTQYKRGERLNYSLKLLSNQNYPYIKIQTLLNYKLIYNTNCLLELTKILQKFQNKNFRKLIQILSPTKGGYLVYYSGITGILPQKYLKAVIINSIKLQNIDLATNLFLSQLHKNNILSARTVLFLENLRIQLNILNINLADLKNTKYFNNFTFIFTLKK